MAHSLNLNKSCPFYCLRCCSRSSPFTLADIILTFLSLISFLIDIITDIIVIAEYYKNNHYTWMILTTSLVCVPSLIVQVFSLRWHIEDGFSTKNLWILHILQLGVCQRYVHLIQLGLKVRKSKSASDLNAFNQEQSDICMLRLFESFTESAPQLVLQLYIMFSTEEWNPWTGISALASVFSLSWGISAYNKAMRNIRPEKKNLSWWGLLFQAMWRIGMVSSRVIAMVLFAAAYGYWLMIAMTIHWISMTVWVYMQNTDFCTTWWEERLYNCVVGTIYCFCYFNVKEGKSRWRMSFFYSVTTLQNTIFVLLFFLSEREKRNQYLKHLFTLLVPAGMISGITSMLLYYRYFHPSGPGELFCTKQTDIHKQDSKNGVPEFNKNCSTLKTCRKGASNNLCVNNCCLEETVSPDENLNASRLSVLSSENNAVCTSDLHRSHSLNCSLKLCDASAYEIYFSSHCQSRKTVANHHRRINYHFRQSANCGMLLEKIHCSCLVLASDTNILSKDYILPDKTSFSTSMPNLDTSFEKESSNSFESKAISHSSNISHECEEKMDFSDSETNSLPVIFKDHIIRLKV